MNYEICKKLKDAGFPQMVTGNGYFSDGESSMTLGEPYASRNVYYPSLSELIEACGDSFWSINKTANGKWFAVAEEAPVAKGDFPQEAVANLWLELNKK